MPLPGDDVPAFRERLARASVPFLAMLNRLPRFVVTGLVAALIVLGLFGPRWVATAALAVVVLVVGWLVALLGTAGGRGRAAMRVGSLVVVFIVLITRAAGAGVGV